MPWAAVQATDVQWSHGCNIMIENDNPFNCRDFAALVPEMVHFCGFGHRCRRVAGPARTSQIIVYERLSVEFWLDRARVPGRDL
jgi:hypothetical protein